MEERHRPALGTLQHGQVVMVRETGRGNLPWRRATVDVIGRKWVELKAEASPLRWRCRIAEQHDGSSSSNYRVWFASLEQYEWDREVSAASRYLRRVGVDVVRFGRSDQDYIRIAIADALRPVLGHSEVSE